jgi:hypothetical protein
MKLTYFILTILLFASCLGTSNKKELVVKGRILLDCSGKPLANNKIELRGERTLLGNPVYEETTTDAEGNFAFTYKPKGGQFLLIRSDSHGRLIDLVPEGKNIDLGEIYTYHVTSFIYKLKVLNPYTADDTLYFRHMDLTHMIMMPGPFRDTTIGIITDHWSLEPHYYDNKDKVAVRSFYNIRNNGSIKTEHQTQYLTPCKTDDFETFTLVVK